MRYCLLAFCVFTLGNVFSQSADTVVLKQITVYGLPEEKFLTGSIITTADSLLQQHFASNHLGDRLALEFPFYFRNYGNGMVSGISMRGTSPQHTAVLWNGININSFSLGQADFSILPSVAFQQVKVHEGGGSARFGSGAFGGTILLTSADQPENILRFTQEVGSFHRYFTSLQGSGSYKKWIFNTRAYHQQSKNDFPLQRTGTRQHHAAFLQRGFLQDVILNLSQSKRISLHYWLNDSDREVQPTMNQRESRDEQLDKNHRLSLQFESNTRYGTTSLLTGYVHDVIVFNGDKSIVERLITKASHGYRFHDKVNIEVNAESNLIRGKIKHFENGTAYDNRYDIFSSLFYNPHRNLKLSLNLRQPFIQGIDAPFLPYLGAEYQVMSGELTVKLVANASKNFRAPTLNDRYWQNAGDRNLLPEVSKNGEAGFQAYYKNFSITSTYFSQLVDQWIQWEPSSTSGNYIPNNITQVKVDGVAFSLQQQVKTNQFRISGKLAGQIASSYVTKASAARKHTIGKMLMYTPSYMGSAMFQIHHKKYALMGSAQLSGERFTTPANDIDYMLPPVLLYNASASSYWIINRHKIEAIFSLKNLANLDYQLYYGRAMPGRNYSLSITYQFNYTNNDQAF